MQFSSLCFFMFPLKSLNFEFCASVFISDHQKRQYKILGKWKFFMGSFEIFGRLHLQTSTHS